MGGIRMIKQDHCDCCGGNTFIGFSHSYDNGYCKKCGNIFTFHWNGCNPFSEDKTCPKCGNHDEVEAEHDIESHIDIIKMFMRCDDLLIGDEDKIEESRKRMRKEINELNRIRREFDKYNEEEKLKEEERRKKEYEEHKKRNK
jgi:hypothetical protein